MDLLDDLVAPDSALRYPFYAAVFLLTFGLLAVIFNLVMKRWQQRSRRSKSNIDDFIVRLFMVPGKWIIFAILLNIFSTLLEAETPAYTLFRKIGLIVLILSLGWLIIQITRALFHYWQNRLDINDSNNLEARKKLTQMSMVERIVVISIALIFVAIALMTIDSIKQLGVSLLASAGLAGIIVGFAAQRSFGQVFSGIQIAFTQPVRLDDVVVIDGEWGRIEEINITYAVVKIWDERRLIVPIDYFLNNPIQNWTRNASDILGSVFLYVAYELPVDPLRDELVRIVSESPHWDGRVQNIQVTNSKEWYKELRILVSSANSSANWDLKVVVRERLIDFINQHYPGSFSRINPATPAGMTGGVSRPDKL